MTPGSPPLVMTFGFLAGRYEFSRRLGYPKQRWIAFCEHCLDAGFEVLLKETEKTRSKYITVRWGPRKFKVRFSDHRPIRGRELRGSCDFFVGKTHTGVRTWLDALVAVRRRFEDVWRDEE